MQNSDQSDHFSSCLPLYLNRSTSGLVIILIHFIDLDFMISENSADVKIKIESEQEGNEKEESFLKDYFQLKISLENLYKQWNSTDTNFNSLSNSFDGVRMLRQDPVENLFSFICSQNNHITRISSMVEKLCTYFGDEICEIKGKQYHAFPNLVALSADDVEGKLRELGFGYRAKYIHQCAKQILEKHSLNWLYELRSVSYKEAHKGNLD